MRFVDSRTGIEILERDECLQLLANDEVGRLGVVNGGAPVILPVNYTLDGESIVIRTEAGTKLNAGPRSPACFEIDWFDRANRRGWSVLVSGRLEEVTPFDGAELERVRQLPVDPWAGPRFHWLRLVPTRITGRRVS
jgi:uncharacterized protein